MAGQRCTANRVIVHDDCREAFIPLLLEASAALKWGDPSEANTVVGPMVSMAHRDRVAAIVQRAASIATPRCCHEAPGAGNAQPALCRGLLFEPRGPHDRTVRRRY